MLQRRGLRHRMVLSEASQPICGTGATRTPARCLVKRRVSTLVCHWHCETHGKTKSCKPQNRAAAFRRALPPSPHSWPMAMSAGSKTSPRTKRGWHLDLGLEVSGGSGLVHGGRRCPRQSGPKFEARLVRHFAPHLPLKAWMLTRVAFKAFRHQMLADRVAPAARETCTRGQDEGTSVQCGATVALAISTASAGHGTSCHVGTPSGGSGAHSIRSPTRDGGARVAPASLPRPCAPSVPLHHEAGGRGHLAQLRLANHEGPEVRPDGPFCFRRRRPPGKLAPDTMYEAILGKACGAPAQVGHRATTPMLSVAAPAAAHQ